VHLFWDESFFPQNKLHVCMHVWTMEGVLFLFFSFLIIQVGISIRIRIRKKMYVLVASVKATSPLVSRGFSVAAMTMTCAWPTACLSIC
jgi:hypothetical protein